MAQPIAITIGGVSHAIQRLGTSVYETHRTPSLVVELDILASNFESMAKLQRTKKMEAIGTLAGGEIVIQTDNRYIDTPLKGYVDVQEGEYVILRVSDGGRRIAAEDLERIFEPF